VFLLTGAVVAHLAVRHPWIELIPAVALLALAVASWFLRPASRRLAGATVGTAGQAATSAHH
jgi:hypothetical protein